jgi:hypothetical protein
LDQTELSKFAAVKTKNELAALEVLMSLHSHPPSAHTTEIAEPELIVWHLIDIAWMYTFQTYFRLKRNEEEKSRTNENAASADRPSTTSGETSDSLNL